MFSERALDIRCILYLHIVMHVRLILFAECLQDIRCILLFAVLNHVGHIFAEYLQAVNSKVFAADLICM